MEFIEVTSTIGIMTIGYAIGRLTEFLIIKFKADKNVEKKRVSK